MSALSMMAAREPEKTACLVFPEGRRITYGQLVRSATQVAQLLTELGLSEGDGVALLLDNNPSYFEIVFGARDRGLYYTPISTHLKPDEAAYIVRDCGAKALFIDAAFHEIIQAIQASDPTGHCRIFTLNGAGRGGTPYEHEIARFSGQAELADAPLGRDLTYSSGTTGRPKGIRHPLIDVTRHAEATRSWVGRNFQFDESSVYLSPAPLYHSAPLRFTMRTLDLGGTVILLRKFDAELSLQAIEQQRVTHSQWVPTMFFRLLGLPRQVKDKYDLRSHRCAIHSAAPCPPEVKEQMIAWWGPIVWEYYSASERNGGTCISSEEWLLHRGSVGRPSYGELHILDENQNELPAGVPGDIYFDGPEFSYHNDAEKTARSRNSKGWSTTGDVGYVDADGYLILTDRRAHMIISGGVNIYPAEIENLLAVHPDVYDVAVFGVPNLEFGEEVKAVVQLRQPERAGPQVEADLIAYCKAKLSNVKCPKSIDFETAMPRTDSGKIFKHVLKRRYAEAT